MVKITQEKRIKDYYKIYEQIYKDPTIYIYELSEKIKRSRNATSKYLQEMYTKEVLIGPYIKMKFVSNYMEYVYLMNFSDPFKISKGLREFPHVLYHAVNFGSWNTVVVTDRHLNFSKLIGFQSMLFQIRIRCNFLRLEMKTCSSESITCSSSVFKSSLKIHWIGMAILYYAAFI